MPPTARDIRVNQPLPRPVFDVYGHCLAEAGEMVETRRQADFLLRYGRVEFGGLDHTLGLDLEEFRDDPFEEIGHLGLMLQDLLRHACADPAGLPERLAPLVARRLNRQQATLTPEQKHNLRAHPHHSVELLRT